MMRVDILIQIQNHDHNQFPTRAAKLAFMWLHKAMILEPHSLSEGAERQCRQLKFFWHSTQYDMIWGVFNVRSSLLTRKDQVVPLDPPWDPQLFKKSYLEITGLCCSYTAFQRICPPASPGLLSYKIKLKSCTESSSLFGTFRGNSIFSST